MPFASSLSCTCILLSKSPSLDVTFPYCVLWSSSSSAAMWHPLKCLLGNSAIVKCVNAILLHTWLFAGPLRQRPMSCTKICLTHSGTYQPRVIWWTFVNLYFTYGLSLLIEHRPRTILLHLELCSVLPPPSSSSTLRVSCCPHLILQDSSPDVSGSSSSSVATRHPMKCLLGNAVIASSYSVPSPRVC